MAESVSEELEKRAVDFVGVRPTDVVRAALDSHDLHICDEPGQSRSSDPDALAHPTSCCVTPWIVSMPHCIPASPSVMTAIENVRWWPSRRAIW
jgi:hypothetical protein